MVVGESRSELLSWLNSTLDINYTKVENCGTGAAYCQLMDCVVGGVPMSRVNFNASTEYDYLQNFKILQATFNRNKITKTIDVEKLVKCRLQDNLELLQWFKKFWHENKDFNTIYDACSRRKSSGINSTSISLSVPKSGGSVQPRSSRSTPTGSRVSSLSSNRSSIPPNSGGSSKIAQLSSQVNESARELQRAHEEIKEYKISVESLETERNFYFNKLREIEILIENIKLLNSDESNDVNSQELVTKIQSILYSTEEGFQSGANEHYEEDSF